MELNFSQIAPNVNHHGYLQVTALSWQNYCWHKQRHAYWYKTVMRLSRLFRGLLFSKHSSRLVIWGCLSIVSNVIWYNYCCGRHTMHGNMLFSTHYILESGGFLVCSVIYLLASCVYVDVQDDVTQIYGYCKYGPQLQLWTLQIALMEVILKIGMPIFSNILYNIWILCNNLTLHILENVCTYSL